MRETMKYNPCYYQLRKGQLQRMLSIIEQNEIAQPQGVVFFGDSIIEMYDIHKYFPDLNTKYNCGIGGATSQELLWIIDEAVIKYQPKVVVMMIGTNDLGNTVMLSPKDIAMNVKNIIDCIRGNCPNTQIILLSTLPCIEKLKSYHHIPGIRCNDLIQMIYTQYQEIILDTQTKFIQLYDEFMNDKNETITDFYCDGLHLNDKGYEKMTSFIHPILKEYI